METSTHISELAKALCKAQKVIKTALKDSTNPHFKSRYADLASVWDAVRDPLTDNNLSIVQTLSNAELKVSCTTMLVHESGQYVRSTMMMTPAQNTPQAMGSCATYLRRYMLQSIAGVAPDDDDGNAASSLPPLNIGVAHASQTNSSTKVAVVEKSVVVSEASKVQEKSLNTSARVTTFSRNNNTHIQKVISFLNKHNRIDLQEQFINSLEGCIWNLETITKKFVEISGDKNVIR